MGFGDKWCRWIKSCLKSANMSILVNESPTEVFTLERGVRRNHRLFKLAAEGLNAMMNEAMSKAIFRGVRVGVEEIVVSHLQYADDTIGGWKYVRFNVYSEVL